MTINYTTLLGLAKPVTGTETGQWGDVVNDEITSLLEDAVANAATFSVTVGDVTLSTTNGASNQARMSTLIITGSPGILRNVIVPSQAKIYVVINQANAEVVIKGAATTGVTVGAGQTAQIAWNGSDFVEIGNYVHGNFVVNGNLSVKGNSTLGDGGADTTTINGQFIGANSNISKATTVSTSAPALAWVKGATYTDTASAGGTTQAHAPFTLLSAPTLATSNIVTYTNASTFYIAGAPSASGSATITNPYAMYVAAGEAYLAGAVTMAATTQNLALGTSQTSGTWTAGGAAQTGALTLDQSTKTHTLNLGTGATESAATKTVNIGTAGVSGSTTAVNIGSAVSGATNNVTINGNPTFNSGTANGVLYLNGSKVATSGTALAFDGTNLGVGVTDFSVTGANAKFAVGAGTINLDDGQFLAWGGGGGRTFVAGDKATGFMRFGISGTEGMRLTSTGLGIGTSSPSAKLTVAGTGLFAGGASNSLGVTSTSGSALLNLNTTGTGGRQFYIYSSDNTNSVGGGRLTFEDGTSGNRLVFDGAAGNLGIGTSSPGIKLDVNGLAAVGTTTASSGAGGNIRYRDDTGAQRWAVGVLGSAAETKFGFYDFTSGQERMVLTTSGNLGLGVTPSAWGNGVSLQGSAWALSTTAGTDSGAFTVNARQTAYGSGSQNYVYRNTAPASNYEQYAGAHRWFTAPSGTAGNAISFTQAMTLDASGQLLLGGTSLDNPQSWGRIAQVINSGSNGAAISVKDSNNEYNIATYNGALLFSDGTSERARITSGGAFLVGGQTALTSGAPAGTAADFRGGLALSAASAVNGAYQELSFPAGIYTKCSIRGYSTGTTDAGELRFFTAPAGDINQERARITSGGDLLVGTTGSLISSGSRFRVTTGGGPTIDAQSTNVGNAVLDAWNSATSGDNLFQRFWTEGTATQRGSIDYNRAGGLVRYNTTSDYRAKDIIGPVQNPGATIDALKVYEGKMKGATQSRPMLIAHEAQEHAPYAVSGVKDEVNEDGTPKFQQMDVSSLVPLLLAEIQSLRARVAALEAA